MVSVILVCRLLHSFCVIRAYPKRTSPSRSSLLLPSAAVIRPSRGVLHLTVPHRTLPKGKPSDAVATVAFRRTQLLYWACVTVAPKAALVAATVLYTLY